MLPRTDEEPVMEVAEGEQEDPQEVTEPRSSAPAEDEKVRSRESHFTGTWTRDAQDGAVAVCANGPEPAVVLEEAREEMRKEETKEGEDVPMEEEMQCQERVLGKDRRSRRREAYAIHSKGVVSKKDFEKELEHF